MAHMAFMTPPAPTVGFDLDMTLIDSRPGIRACYLALSERTGTYIDADLAVTRLGPPLAEELINWFPAEEVGGHGRPVPRDVPDHRHHRDPRADRRPRGHRRRTGGRRPRRSSSPPSTSPTPSCTSPTSASSPTRWSATCGPSRRREALREHGAGVYVGDHAGDVRGARAAGALSVAVATGPCGAEELRAAGADVVLADLTEFPAVACGLPVRRRAPDAGPPRPSAALPHRRSGIRRP